MDKKIIKQLAEIVGVEHVSDDPIELMVHSRDASPIFGEIPSVVIRPGNTSEVSAILKFANENKICVLPRAAGSVTWGASVPNKKGLMVIQMSRMNRVLDVDEDAMVATVEAGCTWSRLERTINPRGWKVAIMPHGAGMIAGVGANVALNGYSMASGGNGMQGDHVTGLEVVLPTGSVVRTGSWAMKGCKPFNSKIGSPGEITRLFLRSGNIYGVITKVALRIYAIPPAKDYLMHSFKSISALVRAAYKIQKYELSSGFQMITKEIVGTTGWPIPIENMIWGSVEGCSPGVVDEKMKMWRQIVESEGGTEVDQTVARIFGAELEDNRIHRYTWANEAYFPGGGRFQILGSVPINRIEEFLEITYGIAIKHGLHCFGLCQFERNSAHMFTVMPYYEKDPEQRQKTLDVGTEAIKAIADAGICLSVLDGVYSPSYDYLDPQTFKLTKSIQKTLDPNNIMQVPWEIGGKTR